MLRTERAQDSIVRYPTPNTLDSDTEAALEQLVEKAKDREPELIKMSLINMTRDAGEIDKIAMDEIEQQVRIRAYIELIGEIERVLNLIEALTDAEILSLLALPNISFDTIVKIVVENYNSKISSYPNS